MNDDVEPIFMSTTQDVAGYSVLECLGLISAEAVVGSNVIKDWTAAITNFFGGRSHDYEGDIADARRYAISRLSELAVSCGANAVVSVRLDHQVITYRRGCLMMVSIVGTAVVLSKDND